MKILKVKKNRNALIIVTTIATVVTLSSFTYYSFTSINSKNLFLDLKQDNFRNFKPIDLKINKDFNDANQKIKDSITDINLKNLPDDRQKEIINVELEKQKIEEITPIEKEKPELPPIKKEEPKTPPVDIDFNDIELKPGEVKQQLEFEGLNINAIVKPQPERKISEYDKTNKLNNRIEYIAITTPDLISIEVTEEIRQKNITNAVKDLKTNLVPSILESIQTEDTPTYSLEDAVGGNATNFYTSIVEKYKRLIDGPNLQHFLVDGFTMADVEKLRQKRDEKLKKLEEHKKNNPGACYYGPGCYEGNVKGAKEAFYLRVIVKLDQSKFNKLTEKTEKELREGYVIDQDNSNVYIDENGALDSFTKTPIINATQTTYARDNSEKRAFGYSDYYGRSPDSISSGKIPGWTDTDVTQSAEYQKYNVSNSDGIQIQKLTRDKKSDQFRNEGIRVIIDASNPSGYQKTLKLIQELKADNKEITSYQIKNMGKNDANQKFKEILEALPDKLPQLELFFITTNTSSLIALENKEIDELGIFTVGTPGKALDDDYSINPLALRNVAWVNTIDYNASSSFGNNPNIASRIVFDSLAFENDDYKENESDPYKRINDGLRLAYWVRNNEKVFQGGFGPGLKPDHDEQNNSYPQGLDLSRVKKLKSLKGLKFHDEQKTSNAKSRKLRRLVLYNDNSAFEISIAELNQSNFASVLVTEQPQMPKTKILFSNGNITNKLKITNSENVTLTSEGISNLNVFLEYAESIQKKIVVDDINVKNSLNGFSVTVEDKELETT
ncbi:putative immunoglobulin-blocking virulence protein [[Mycoplasma] collis]|uniref:putative immunoglobulin-blocking virulence protein n=1 Tax=[Mycoplasma] collis TaxID=2127 RepID=UPI0006910B75|nr:putative immunoglobulin-blocking virulence protein [[Mycoplasma] collis]